MPNIPLLVISLSVLLLGSLVHFMLGRKFKIEHLNQLNQQRQELFVQGRIPGKIHWMTNLLFHAATVMIWYLLLNLAWAFVFFDVFPFDLFCASLAFFYLLLIGLAFRLKIHEDGKKNNPETEKNKAESDQFEKKYQFIFFASGSLTNMFRLMFGKK